MDKQIGSLYYTYRKFYIPFKIHKNLYGVDAPIIAPTLQGVLFTRFLSVCVKKKAAHPSRRAFVRSGTDVG